MKTLNDLLEFYIENDPKREKCPNEIMFQDQSATSAYVFLTFAWGFLRLGDEDAAKDLIKRAEVILEGQGDFHDHCKARYFEKLNEISPIVPKIERPQLDRIFLYHADFLSAHSITLDPEGIIDPYENWDGRAGSLAGVLEHPVLPLEHCLSSFQNYDNIRKRRVNNFCTFQYHISSINVEGVNIFYEQALENLLISFNRVTDSFSSNRFFCKSAIEHMENIVYFATQIFCSKLERFGEVIETDWGSVTADFFMERGWGDPTFWTKPQKIEFIRELEQRTKHLTFQAI